MAAGSGSRFGAPKQFTDLGGATVTDRAVAAAAGCAEGVVLVLPSDTGLSATGLSGRGVPAGVELRTVKGAATRSGSVRCGLAAVPEAAEVVVVHDAARPLAAAYLFEAVIGAVRQGADAAVPVIQVTDTIRRRSGGTLDRDELAAVQTPQAFAARALRQAHASGGEATDDAALVESAGGTVVLVDGDRRNIKLTAPSDLVVAEALLVTDLGAEAPAACPAAVEAHVGEVAATAPQIAAPASETVPCGAPAPGGGDAR